MPRDAMGEFIRRCRIERHGESQRAFARRCKAGIGTVAGWEQGATPHPHFYAPLAKACGVTVERLLDLYADSTSERQATA